MGNQAVAEAIEAWAEATVSGMTAYHHEPEDFSANWPLAVGSIQRNRRVGAEPDLPAQHFEHTQVRVWRVQLLLLVDPDPPATASNLLYGYVDQLAEALRRDRTLGGRVQFSSPYYDASFEPAEVEYPNGTVARAATFELTVGEQQGA